MLNQQRKDAALVALDNKHHAILITGNIFDLHVDFGKNTLFYRPLFLAEKLHEQGTIVLRYSRSSGLSIHRYIDIKTDRKILDEVLQRTGLNKFVGNKDISPTEVVEIFRGFKTIATNRYSSRFAIIIDFVPHLTASQSADREMQIVAETISDIANLPSAQKVNSCLIVYAYDDSNLSPLLKFLHKVHYSYPCIEEYEQFFRIISERNDEFASTKLCPKEAARLARGLNLTQLASLFRDLKAKGSVLTKDELLAEKERLIEQVSEKTLTVLSTDITFNDIAGLEVPKKIMKNFAEQLANQSPTSPRAILLAGPPGTGKTTMASALANACGFNLVELSDEIKSMWVGASEARLSLALQLIESLSPVILFIDEIDQQFTNRSSASLDGGVSSHYLKTLFKFAARDDLRGKICIVGCSNTPQLLDPAMINRFITVPLLEATPMDLAAIFPKIQKRIMGKETLNPSNEILLQGCELLYKKGASPRQIFDVINRTISYHGFDFREEHILESCIAFRGSGDPVSGAYSSLSAIRLTAFEDYLPWAGNRTYPFPWYLDGIVNHADGNINEMELSRKLQEFRAHSKF